MAQRLAPELVSGFVEIDGQHGFLLELLEAALRAVQSDSLAATKRALQDLGDYLLAHFAEEERFMAEAEYPERGRHKSAHDLFMQDFVQLAREIDVTGLSVPTTEWITTRVPEWIKFHIGVNDVPLGRYLSAKRFRPQIQVKSSASKPQA